MLRGLNMRAQNGQVLSENQIKIEQTFNCSCGQTLSVGHSKKNTKKK